MIVKGKTKSGIKYAMNSALLEDTRLYFYMTRAKSDEASDSQKIEAFCSLFQFVFGGYDGAMVFMNEVANAHNGKCDADVLMNEFLEILDAVKAKNSSSSQT